MKKAIRAKLKIGGKIFHLESRERAEKEAFLPRYPWVFMQAHIIFPNGAMLLKHDVPVELGRGKFGINDSQVSRQHARIVFSNTTETLIIKSISQTNPSYVWRNNSKNPIKLTTGESETLQDGDKISLLPNNYFLNISINKKTPVSSPKDPQLKRTDTIPCVTKRRLTQTPSFETEETNSPKKQRVTRKKMPRLESSFILPQAFIEGSELKLLKVVGKGTCGEVWKANWNGNRVAVKKIFRALLSDSALQEFKSEASILSSLRHPNVVQFWGFSKIEGDNCIVTEFMENGALNDVVYNKDLDYKTMVKFALGAAEGIRYLHGQKIIHRDLKTMNFLVGNDNCVKVSDFGLARHIEPNKTTQTFCGTVPWTAPELLAGKPYSTKVDVYSYGIVLWELCARKIPYEGMSQTQIILGVARDNLRPKIPPNSPPNLAKLMQLCWHVDPEKRPDMEEIIAYLRESTNDAGEVQSLPRSLDFEEMELTLGKPDVPILQDNLIKLGDLLITRSTHKLYSGSYGEQNVYIQLYESSVSASEDFGKELDIIRKLRSPVLPTTIGYCINPRLCIVTEMVQPNLRTYLKAKQNISLMEGIKLMLACANSMTVLHTWTPPLLHRDLTSSKFLLYEGSSIKIADIAQARFVDEKNIHSLREIKGEEMEYCPPECFDPNGIYSMYSDVYSFSIVMWEIVNCCLTKSYKKPYFDVPDTKNITFMNDIVKNFKRPSIPKDCPQRICELIEAAWHPVPEERPTFADLSNCLDQLTRITTTGPS